MTHLHRALLLASATLLATSCSSLESVGEAELVALGSAPLRFETAFREGVYAVRDAEDSFWFSTVPSRPSTPTRTERRSRRRSSSTRSSSGRPRRARPRSANRRRIS